MLFAISCSKSFDQIELLPNIGIAIGKDTVFLESTNPRSLTKHFNIKDTADNEGVHWDGYDPEGNEVHGYYEIESIHFKGIGFEFRGPTTDSLLLKNIYITPASSPYEISLNNINIRQKTTKILRTFPNSSRLDISKENTSDFGVLFQTDTSGNISRVSIHSKYKPAK